MSQVREAIKIEEEKLQDVYQIKAESDSLAAIINAHKETKAERLEKNKVKRNRSSYFYFKNLFLR